MWEHLRPDAFSRGRAFRPDAFRSDRRAPLSVKKLIGATELMIPMAGLIDKEAELARLAKEVARLVGECGRIEGKLGNEAFVAKAPEAVITKEREKLEDYRLQLTKLEAQQAEIAAL